MEEIINRLFAKAVDGHDRAFLSRCLEQLVGGTPGQNYHVQIGLAGHVVTELIGELASVGITASQGSAHADGPLLTVIL